MGAIFSYIKRLKVRKKNTEIRIFWTILTKDATFAVLFRSEETASNQANPVSGSFFRFGKDILRIPRALETLQLWERTINFSCRKYRFVPFVERGWFARFWRGNSRKDNSFPERGGGGLWCISFEEWRSRKLSSEGILAVKNLSIMDRKDLFLFKEIWKYLQN